MLAKGFNIGVADGGGQFGGRSGCDGFGVALRQFTKLLDCVGIGYTLTDYGDLKKLWPHKLSLQSC